MSPVLDKKRQNLVKIDMDDAEELNMCLPSELDTTETQDVSVLPTATDLMFYPCIYSSGNSEAALSQHPGYSDGVDVLTYSLGLRWSTRSTANDPPQRFRVRHANILYQSVASILTTDILLS